MPDNGWSSTIRKMLRAVKDAPWVTNEGGKGVGKPLTAIEETHGNLVRILGEALVGKTIASAEMLEGEYYNPAYLFIVFTDETRVVITIWKGDLLGKSLRAIVDLPDDVKEAAPFFIDEQLIPELERLKKEQEEQWRREQRQRLADISFPNWGHGTEGVKAEVKLTFPDGEIYTAIHEDNQKRRWEPFGG